MTSRMIPSPQLMVWCMVLKGTTQPISNNIIAPKRIINEKLTEDLRLQAENTTAPVYDYIVSAYSSATENIMNFYDGVYQMHEEYLDDAAVKAANSVYSFSGSSTKILLSSAARLERILLVA